MGQRTPISFIATSEPAQAKAFYGNVLGLTCVEESPYALAFRDAGHMLRIQVVEGHRPATYTAYGWLVSDIEGQISALSAKGVACLQFDQLQQDATGIWTTPDGNKIAWFADPSGNILSLTEYAAPLA